MKSVMLVLVRVLAPVTVILFTCSALAALQQQRAEPSANLQSFVNETRLTQRLPGLAVVIVRTDGQPWVYVSGERRIDKGDPITVEDRMHLGSLTKAITATVIGALAERHRMTPETTIGQVFPELSAKMQAGLSGSNRTPRARGRVDARVASASYALVIVTARWDTWRRFCWRSRA